MSTKQPQEPPTDKYKRDLECPGCGGSGTVLGFLPVYSLDVPQVDRKPVIEMNCNHCNGTGSISQNQLDRMSLGRELREARKAAGYGLRQAAELLSCSPSHLSLAEQGFDSTEGVMQFRKLIESLPRQEPNPYEVQK